MLSQDFENFELRLQTLKEESAELFSRAEDMYTTQYESQVREIFPRDVLGIQSKLKGYFILRFCDGGSESSHSTDIFKDVSRKVLDQVPLSQEKKEQLHTLLMQRVSGERVKIGEEKLEGNIHRDPFFVLVEEFSMDGIISQEEFAILQQSYNSSGNLISAVESLPRPIRDLFHEHISLLHSTNNQEKLSSFEHEYAPELKKLQNKGIDIEAVMVLVSRFYYINPGKLRKHEQPKRRLRRSFKLALLRLLRLKLGNIDAQKILERFENGESFEDYFFLIYELMEIIDENPDGEEIYQVLDTEEEEELLVVEAEENTKKILAGESLIMKIAALFGKTESALEEGILEKVLDEDTHFLGEEIHFAHGNDTQVGVLAENNTDIEESDDEENGEEEFSVEHMSPHSAYEILKHQFQKLEEEKKQAFREGKYDYIDIINERLLILQSKLEKLSKILGVVERE